jgi:hypothetical protein
MLVACLLAYGQFPDVTNVVGGYPSEPGPLLTTDTVTRTYEIDKLIVDGDATNEQCASDFVRLANNRFPIELDSRTVLGPYDIVDESQCCQFCTAHDECVGYQVFERHKAPTGTPTLSPTELPTAIPTESPAPTTSPTALPTKAPTQPGIQLQIQTGALGEASSDGEVRVLFCYQTSGAAADCNTLATTILGGSSGYPAITNQDNTHLFFSSRDWPTYVKVELVGTDNWCMGKLRIKRLGGTYQYIYATNGFEGGGASGGKGAWDFAGDDATADCAAAGNRSSSVFWFGEGTNSQMFSVPPETTVPPTKAPTKAPTEAPTAARRRLVESGVETGECYISTSIPYYYATTISPALRPFYSGASMMLRNNTGRLPGPVAFSPAAGAFVHPSTHTDTRFRDDRKPLTITISPEDTTENAYGPFILSDAVGVTTMSFYVEGHGWSSNTTATKRVTNLPGWPTRLRLYVGSKLYQPGSPPVTPKLYTASGRSYGLSRTANEYVIDGGLAGGRFVSRKTLYCIVLPTSTDDCRSAQSVFTEYTAPIVLDPIDADSTVTVWSYVQQNSNPLDIRDRDNTTSGLMRSATYALSAQNSMSSAGTYVFASSAKVSAYSSVGEFHADAFKTALVEILPRAELSRASVTSVTTSGPNELEVSFTIDFTNQAFAQAAQQAWASGMSGTSSKTSAFRAEFARRMRRAMCSANHLQTAGAVALTTPGSSLTMQHLNQPIGGTVSLKTVPPTDTPTAMPTNLVTGMPTMQPTKWYSTAPVQKVCPAGTRRVTGSDVGSTLPQFVAVEGTFVCVACPKGQFQTMADQDTCEACPLGQFAASAGQAYCVSGTPECKGGASRLCWVSREGGDNDLEVKWQSFEAGREVTAVAWPKIDNTHPKWRFVAYNLTGMKTSAITSVYGMSEANLNVIAPANWQSGAGTFNIGARTAVASRDDSTEPRPHDPIRFVRRDSSQTDGGDSRVNGDGFWFFKAAAVFADETGGAVTTMNSRNDLKFVVAQPKAPIISLAPLPQFVQPTKKLTIVAEGAARPAAHARWLKDGKEVISAAVPFKGTDASSGILSKVFAGQVTFEQTVKGGAANGGTNLADANGGAPTIVYTLTVDSVGRQDAGEYTLELTNYAGQVVTGGNSGTTGAKVEVACTVCDSCAANSVPSSDNSACVCAAGYYNRPEAVIDYNTNPLGFECIRCPEGAICDGNPTLDAIITKPLWYRHGLEDAWLVPCRAGGGGNYIREAPACVGGSLLIPPPAGDTRRLQDAATAAPTPTPANPNQQCVPPYTGLLCSQCKGYFYMILDDECRPCPKEHSMVKMKLGMRILMTLSFFLAAYVLTVIIRMPIRNARYTMRQRHTHYKDDVMSPNQNETTLNTSAESAADDQYMAGGALADGAMDAVHRLDNAIDKGSHGIKHMVADGEKFAYDIFERSDNPVTVARVKILISWLQCIGPIALTFAVQWPHEFRKHIYVMNTIFMLDFVEMARNIGYVACEFPTDYQTGFWPHMLMFPVTCIVCGIGYYRALMLGPIDSATNRRGRMKKEFLKHKEASYARAVQCVLFFVFLWYPGLCQRLFRVFKCIDIGGSSYLAADLSVLCWEGDHDFYARVSGVFIAIYVIGIPFGIYCALMAHRSIILADRRNKRADLARARWGILYSCFHPQHWYFELIDMLRKVLLAGGLVLVEYDSPVQTLIGVLVCLAFVTFHLKAGPYRLRVDNLFQDITSWHLLFTLLIGMWITASKSVGIAGLTMGTSVYEDTRTNQLLLILFYVTLCMFSFMFVLLIPGVYRCMQPMLQCLNEAFCLGGSTFKTGAADAGRSPSPTRRRRGRSRSPARDQVGMEQVQMTIEGEAPSASFGVGGEAVYQYPIEELAQMYPMATHEQLMAMQQEQQYAAMQQQQQQDMMSQDQLSLAQQQASLDMVLAGQGMMGTAGQGMMGMDGQMPRSPNQMEEQAEAEAYMNAQPVQFGQIEEKVAPAVKTGAIYQF